MRMQIGARLFEGPGPFLMGIVNVTPDSFSDGGRFLDPSAAVDRALELADEGADIVDLGGESTRPGAPSVAAGEEIRRVVPVIERLRARGFPLPISIDTSKAAVAVAALTAGADLVNDVTGFSDRDLALRVAAAGVPAVVMHMRGTPADMQSMARYDDVARDVRRELESSIARAEAAGIERERIVVDPGIGFAKTAEQSVELIARVGELRALGRPILVGPSRKSFIGKLTGAPVAERVPGTLAAVTACVLAGVELIRVHDVAPARQAAVVATAIRAALRPDGASSAGGAGAAAQR